jgi:hypothetical protein
MPRIGEVENTRLGLGCARSKHEVRDNAAGLRGRSPRRSHPLTYGVVVDSVNVNVFA